MAEPQELAQHEDAAQALATFAASVRYERLPSAVVDKLKEMVLDTLGTTLAANTLGVGCPEVVAVALAAGGAPESTILGYGDRVPAFLAAWANGAMAHALNYDDAPGASAVHLGPTSVPAALAMAERRGGVSGQEFLAALGAGTEVTARLGLAIHRAEVGRGEAKPQPSQLTGYFNAAVSAGRVLGFSAPQLHSVLGLALMQAAGNRQVVLQGTPAKALYTGFSNQGGVLSALLAEQGVRGDCAVFEGEAGLFNTLYQGRYLRPMLVERLGEEFHLLDMGFKPWPISANVHPFMDAALQLRERYALDAARIDEVLLRGGTHLRPWCEPLAVRQKPRTAVEAEDSIYFGVAKILANGQLTLADFTPDGLRQPAASALAERIRYALDDALGKAGEVEVSTRDGQRYTCRVETPLGHSANPLPEAHLVAKFRDCAAHAATPLPDTALEEVVELVAHLERVADVGGLAALLGPPG